MYLNNNFEVIKDPTAKAFSYIVFMDPSPTLPSEMLANHLELSKFEKINLILLREKVSRLSDSLSLANTIMMSILKNDPTRAKDAPVKSTMLKVRKISLKAQMDHASLAEQAVGLNLKLMKWRQAPELNLEILTKTKCLLLGAGSLGCQVARNLLSWGFTHITFVDNGRVSYSNPVRQCLFTFEDSKALDNYKATIAAKRLKEIYPNVQSEGHVLSIPMPGHSVGEDPILQQEVVK